MGHAAVESLVAGRCCEMVGVVNHTVTYTPFDKATKHHLEVSPYLLELVEVLSS